VLQRPIRVDQTRARDPDACPLVEILNQCGQRARLHLGVGIEEHQVSAAGALEGKVVRTGEALPGAVVQDRCLGE
jgi:hypothetical protein